MGKHPTDYLSINTNHNIYFYYAGSIQKKGKQWRKLRKLGIVDGDEKSILRYGDISRRRKDNKFLIPLKRI